MVAKKGVDRVTDYFQQRKLVILIGFLCAVYLVYNAFAAGTDLLIAKILPPMPAWYFYLSAIAVLVYQLYVWRSFKLFYSDWHKSVLVWVLLLSEFITLLFAACLVSWPIYFIYDFLLYSTRS